MSEESLWASRDPPRVWKKSRKSLESLEKSRQGPENTCLRLFPDCQGAPGQTCFRVSGPEGPRDPCKCLGVPKPQGSVNGGFQTVVRVLSGDRIPLPPFNLNLTSFLPHLNLLFTSFLPQFNLRFFGNLQPWFGNHGLQTLGNLVVSIFTCQCFCAELFNVFCAHGNPLLVSPCLRRQYLLFCISPVCTGHC